MDKSVYGPIFRCSIYIWSNNTNTLHWSS